MRSPFATTCGAAEGRRPYRGQVILMLRRVTALSLLVAALSLLVATPARADAPFRLADQVTDRVGALAGRQDETQTALARLRNQTGLQLFVVFVRSFDGSSAQQWADTTARRSDLGDRDAILAVATGDRAYAYAFDQGYPLTAAQLAEVAGTAIEPALAQNDWAGAVVGAADGYRAVLQGRPVSAPQIQPGQRDPRPTGLSGAGLGGAGGLICLLVPLVAVLGAVLLLRRARRRRLAAAGTTAGTPPAGTPPVAGPPDPAAGVSTEELNNRANALLIELDDDLRASERELGLATGTYGAQATASFQAALDTARQEVAEAFRLRLSLDGQSLDHRSPDEQAVDGRSFDGQPFDGQQPANEAARRGILAEIIRRCEAADARLDAESETFDELRDLQGRVEQVSAELGQRRAAADSRLPAAATALRELRTRYTGAGVDAVAGNVEQARERLAFAGAALDRTTDALSRGDRAAAALTVRGAEQAIDQVDQLLGALEQADAVLAAARASAEALVAEVESEVAAARTAMAAGGDPAAVAALSTAVSEAEQALIAVRAGLTAPTSDPPAAVRRLEQVDAALDQALTGIRNAAERAERARGMLAQTVPVARAEIAATADFITTRRGAVGGQARAWLAEAQRQLALAESLAGADPATALAHAQQAHRLAASAGQAARADVEQWGGPAGFGGGGDPMAGLAGAVLGGILAGGLRHGGGYGGGFGGGYGGGFSGGGFGGSGGRSRRTGGGRF